eukprot:UN32474
MLMIGQERAQQNLLLFNQHRLYIQFIMDLKKQVRLLKKQLKPMKKQLRLKKKQQRPLKKVNRLKWLKVRSQRRGRCKSYGWRRR